jgi:hypothetical protein
MKAENKLMGSSNKQLQRLAKGGRVKQGIAIRSAIKKMIALEIGNERKVAQAAELITATPEEFEEKLNLSLPALPGYSEA